MNNTLNRIPENVKTVHLIAVCGTGMGALACMLNDMGFKVTGSDQHVYPPMSDFLKSRGIGIFPGFNPDHLSYGPDLVVVGNAVRKDNPEAVGMAEMGLPFCSMPQAITRFVAAGKRPIVITGTHGKTTLSAILAWLFYRANRDPSFIIGGILKNFNSNYRLGAGDHIVLEGDEYDTAFFDKGPKFLHYHPEIALLTSVEFDHADIFGNIDHVIRAFDRFIENISPNASIIACDENPQASALIKNRNCEVITYGKGDHSEWRLDNIDIRPPWSIFKVWRHGRYHRSFRTPMMGEHNHLNTLAAIAAADKAGIDMETIAHGIETFTGVKRRQEIRGQKRGITVMDDFAHHPTAVRETVRAVKPFCPNGRLIAVFEPRTNTSMRNVFQNVYPASFGNADIVCIRKPPLLHKIPEAEQFSSKKLVDDLNRRGSRADYFPDTESIIDFLVDNAHSGDLILIMSNGGFDNIHERLLEAL
jgi:UDP-N-acetylmuramate: L-alanyl-gamma-D-glutamyl-meso-diaminopimelate ligase